MGQVTSMLLPLSGKGGLQFERQIREIADRIYDRFTARAGKQTLTSNELYTLVLLVFNDINKLLPGPHCDPPSKEEVEKFDANKDGVIDREEFHQFVEKFASHIVNKFSKVTILTAVAAPAVLAPLTKAAAEKVPGMEKIAATIPNTIIASAIAIALLIIPNALFGKGKQ